MLPRSREKVGQPFPWLEVKNVPCVHKKNRRLQRKSNGTRALSNDPATIVLQNKHTPYLGLLRLDGTFANNKLCEGYSFIPFSIQTWRLTLHEKVRVWMFRANTNTRWRLHRCLPPFALCPTALSKLFFSSKKQ